MFPRATRVESLRRVGCHPMGSIGNLKYFFSQWKWFASHRHTNVYIYIYVYGSTVDSKLFSQVPSWFIYIFYCSVLLGIGETFPRFHSWVLACPEYLSMYLNLYQCTYIYMYKYMILCRWHFGKCTVHNNGFGFAWADAGPILTAHRHWRTHKYNRYICIQSIYIYIYIYIATAFSIITYSPFIPWSPDTWGFKSWHQIPFFLNSVHIYIYIETRINGGIP